MYNRESIGTVNKSWSVCITSKWKNIDSDRIWTELIWARSHSFLPAMIKGIFHCCLLKALASKPFFMRLKISTNWTQLIVDVVLFQSSKGNYREIMWPWHLCSCFSHYSFPLLLGSSVLHFSLHTDATAHKEHTYGSFTTQKSPSLLPLLLLRKCSNTWR